MSRRFVLVMPVLVLLLLFSIAPGVQADPPDHLASFDEDPTGLWVDYSTLGSAAPDVVHNSTRDVVEFQGNDYAAHADSVTSFSDTLGGVTGSFFPDDESSGSSDRWCEDFQTVADCSAQGMSYGTDGDVGYVDVPSDNVYRYFYLEGVSKPSGALNEYIEVRVWANTSTGNYRLYAGEGDTTGSVYDIDTWEVFTTTKHSKKWLISFSDDFESIRFQCRSSVATRFSIDYTTVAPSDEFGYLHGMESTNYTSQDGVSMTSDTDHALLTNLGSGNERRVFYVDDTSTYARLDPDYYPFFEMQVINVTDSDADGLVYKVQVYDGAWKDLVTMADDTGYIRANIRALTSSDYEAIGILMEDTSETVALGHMKCYSIADYDVAFSSYAVDRYAWVEDSQLHTNQDGGTIRFKNDPTISVDTNTYDRYNITIDDATGLYRKIWINGGSTTETDEDTQDSLPSGVTMDDFQIDTDSSCVISAIEFWPSGNLNVFIPIENGASPKVVRTLLNLTGLDQGSTIRIDFEDSDDSVGYYLDVNSTDLIDPDGESIDVPSDGMVRILFTLDEANSHWSLQFQEVDFTFLGYNDFYYYRKGCVWMSIGSNDYDGLMIMHHLTGSIDYARTMGEITNEFTISIDSGWPTENHSVSPWTFLHTEVPTADTSGNSYEALYSKNMSYFGFWRAEQEIYSLLEDNGDDYYWNVDYNVSFYFYDENQDYAYRVLFRIVDDYDSVGGSTGLDSYLSIDYYDSGWQTIIDTGECDTIPGDRTRDIEAHVGVWRNTDNHLGVMVGCEPNDDNNPLYQYEDSPVNSTALDQYWVWMSEEPLANHKVTIESYWKAETTLEDAVGGTAELYAQYAWAFAEYASVTGGVAQPHFSSTWYDLIRVAESAPFYFVFDWAFDIPDADTLEELGIFDDIDLGPMNNMTWDFLGIGRIVQALQDLVVAPVFAPINTFVADLGQNFMSGIAQAIGAVAEASISSFTWLLDALIPGLGTTVNSALSSAGSALSYSVGLFVTLISYILAIWDSVAWFITWVLGILVLLADSGILFYVFVIMLPCYMFITEGYEGVIKVGVWYGTAAWTVGNWLFSFGTRVLGLVWDAIPF